MAKGIPTGPGSEYDVCLSQCGNACPPANDYQSCIKEGYVNMLTFLSNKAFAINLTEVIECSIVIEKRGLSFSSTV